MDNRISFSFAADHPSAAGHFPGDPIVPGALLLDKVARLIAKGSPLFHVSIHAAKFMQPVRPGETIVLTWQDSDDAIRFECSREGVDGKVLSGSLSVKGAESC